MIKIIRYYLELKLVKIYSVEAKGCFVKFVGEVT